MPKGSVSGDHVNSAMTRMAVRHAVDEVQHAASPGRRSPRTIFSWLVALTAGGAVAWRSLRATRELDDAAIESSGTGAGAPDIRTRAGAARSGSDTKPLPADRDRAHVGRRAHRTDKSHDGADRDRGCPEKTVGPMALASELWCRFQADECMMRAQALAFIGVLSLGPVLLFALAALGFVIHNPAQVASFVHGLVAQMLPGREAADAANNLIAQTHIEEAAHTLMKGKWWAVAIGVISLLWAADGLFAGASDPMNAAWNVRETRNFVTLRLVCLGVFLASGALFLLSLVPSSLPSLLGRLNIPVLSSLPPGAWWIEAIAWILAILVDAVMFAVIYKFLPNAPVRWKSAMVGGIIAGILWELFKKGFAVYIAHFGNYNKLYGTLGGAVLLVTWIWYSCVVLLVGAIICKMYNEHTREGGVVRTSRDADRPDRAERNERQAA